MSNIIKVGKKYRYFKGNEYLDLHLVNTLRLMKNCGLSIPIRRAGYMGENSFDVFSAGMWKIS